MAEQHAARLQFEGKEVEFVLMLFQPVNFKLETRISIDERAGVIRFLGHRPWLDPAPYSALVKLGAEEFGRLSQKFRALERSSPFISVLTKLADLQKGARAKDTSRKKITSSNDPSLAKVTPPRSATLEKFAPWKSNGPKQVASAKLEKPAKFASRK